MKKPSYSTTECQSRAAEKTVVGNAAIRKSTAAEVMSHADLNGSTMSFET